MKELIEQMTSLIETAEKNGSIETGLFYNLTSTCARVERIDDEDEDNNDDEVFIWEKE